MAPTKLAGTMTGRALTCAVLVLLAYTLLAFARPTAAQVRAQPPLEVYHGFTLIDGRGGPPIPDGAISVRGNEIVAVGSRRELLSGPSAPRSAIVVNLGGGYVIPGLIDAHVHLATLPDRPHAEAELYRLLYGGVTAVRDMAGDARMLASLARDSRLGEIDAPDVYFSALMAGPSFMTDARAIASTAGETPGEVPWMQAITPETDLVTAVARAKGTYATGIKIYANLSAAEVAAITEEGHRQGMQIWAHAMVFPARPLEVIQAGVDVVSHVCYLAWEAMAQAPTEYRHREVPRYDRFTVDSPVFTSLFDEMKQRGTILDATLATYARADALPDSDPDAPTERCNTDFARALVRQANEQGVAIDAGTDFTTPPDDPYPALYQELEELVTNGGLSPMQAIVAATKTAAEATGVEATHGILAQGRPVDFVFLKADPLADIRNLRTVRSVWKNAVRYDRETYRSKFPQPEFATRTSRGAATPRLLLDAWLAMWRRYDLDQLEQLFVLDDGLTYFPSDKQELIQGFEAVRRYHESLGFTPGGFQPEHELWLEGVTVSTFGESAVVSAVWYFGNRVTHQADGHGPLTMVLTHTSSGWRIAHVNFGNYPAGS